jgi:hypothetical protein
VATSGTVGQTQLTTIEILEHAARRCGLLAAQMTPEHLKLMRNNLFLFLSQLSNRGINLWALDRILVGLYPNQVEYEMPVGTIDVLNALLRTPARLSGTVASSAGGTASNLTDGDVETACTQVSTNGNMSFDFGDPIPVTTVGLLPAATGPLTLALECSTDGVSWSTLVSVPLATYTDRVWAWFEVEPSRSTRYFRVRESGGGTLDLRELYVSSTSSDVTIGRMNRDDYTSIPDKVSPGSPRQYWFDRQLTPRMLLWPTPSTTFELMYLAVHRHVQDVGAYTNTLELPQRWLDPVIWNLAWRTAFELPELKVERVQYLEKYAKESLRDAEDEERDNSPIFLTPGIRAYTR